MHWYYQNKLSIAYIPSSSKMILKKTHHISYQIYINGYEGIINLIDLLLGYTFQYLTQILQQCITIIINILFSLMLF